MCLAVAARTNAGNVLTAPALWSFCRGVGIDYTRVSVFCVGRGFGACGAVIKTAFVKVICDV